MGEGIDVGGMHRHHGIEKMGQTDPLGFDGEFEIVGRCIETPWAVRIRQGDEGFVSTEEHPFPKAARTVLVVQGDGVLTNFLQSDDADDLSFLDSGKHLVRSELFKLYHECCLPCFSVTNPFVYFVFLEFPKPTNFVSRKSLRRYPFVNGIFFDAKILSYFGDGKISVFHEIPFCKNAR